MANFRADRENFEHGKTLKEVWFGLNIFQPYCILIERKWGI